ncbi:MAG: hypothetical protein AAB316_12970, partial [Bacteroidota bacterium]
MKQLFPLIFSTFLGFCLPATAQDALSSHSIENLLRQSEMLARAGDRDQSETSVRLALRQAAAATPEIKAKALLALSEHHLLFMEFDSALAYATQALRLSEAENLEEAKTEALLLTGTSHFRQLDLAPALEACEQGLTRAKKSGDKRLEARCLSCIAGCLRTHHNTPKYEQAAVDFEEALVLYESIGDTAGMVRTLLVLTDMYRSEIYQGRLDDQVNAYFQRAKSLLDAYPHALQKIGLLNTGGVLSAIKNQHEAAFDQWSEALAMSEKLGLGYMIQHLNLRISEYYKDRKEFNKALLAMDRAIAAYPGYFHDAGAHLYAAIYQESGDFEKAAKLFEYSLSTMDSTYEKKKADLVTEWEVKFQTNEKEQALQVHKSRSNLLLLIAILSVLLTGFLVFGFFDQRRARRKLSRQNKIIEQQAAELRHLDELKSRFFANVSHELRTPLTLM